MDGARYRCFVQFSLARGECARGAFGVGGEKERGVKGGKGGDEEDRAGKARIAGIRPVFKKIGDGGSVVEDEEEQVQPFNVSTAPYALTFTEFKGRAVLVFDADDDKENEPPLSPADSMEPLATIEEEDEEEAEIAGEQDVEEGEKEKPDPFAVCRSPFLMGSN